VLDEPTEDGPRFESVATVTADRIADDRLRQVFGGGPFTTAAKQVFRRAALVNAVASQADEALLAFSARPPVVASVNGPSGDGRHVGLTERLQLVGA
jgi:hypothetical protein